MSVDAPRIDAHQHFWSLRNVDYRGSLPGSDWPVCLMAGDYERVWNETLRVLDGVPGAARDAVLGASASALYGLAR